MTMCAYSEDYLSMAQKVLGDMLGESRIILIGG